MVKSSPQLMNEGSSSFLRAARAGNLEKVLEYLNGSLDINTSNMNGMNALHLASKEGHSEMVKELLKRGANVNAGTNKGNTALHIASLGGKLEVVEILVENGANVNAQSLNGFTPLYMAAQENHDNVVRYLLSHGANQSLATEDGFTPLAVALQQGHDKVVTILLENDTKGKVRLPALHIAAKKDDCKAAALLLQSDQKPDVTSKSGFTPLHIAAHYGNENIGTLLLDKGANINFTAKHKITPLHVAAKWGKAHMVQLLLDRGAQIDAATRDGLTPLHCAARSGHEPVVDLLLKRGAPYSAKTKNGLAPLHMASQGDHIDSARTLLAYKAPVDDVTVDFLTPLHVAAHCGHVKVAKLLLDHKANVNARALNGFVPLHIACKKNRIKVVELLLKHGASIEVTTESGLTPLHVASFMGCINIVIYLIQNGADVDGATVRGETPIHLAARASQAEIIKILLRNGALVDRTAREDQTALHIASRLNNTEIVQLLLARGASVDVATKDQYTALHIAAKEGHREVAAYLLEQGASLTATTKKGFTPLHLAAKYGKITVAGLLLEKEAPVDAQGKNGVTPLHVAAHYDHVNVALLLLEKKASPHATAKNGYTPLHIAAKKKQIDIATTLLEYGAEANAESKAGFTPLHLAAQEGHTDMGELLISHKANVNAKSKLELTPLHLAAQGDRVAVAQVLLKKRADVNAQTKQGYTPLHVACHNGAVGMIKLLLQAGANVDITTQHGYTPLHQAAQQGHTLVINLLLDHKASPNKTTNLGYTPLAIAQKCNYISVVETLKTVTEVTTTSIITTTTGEKYSYNNPETMQETFMTTDSEDEGGEGADNWEKANLNYEKGDGGEYNKHDESFGFDVTHDESISRAGDLSAHAPLIADESISPSHIIMQESMINNFTPDNIDISRPPTSVGRLKWKTFLVSFMVDARGGAMRGCRHSGVRIIIPPRKAPMPMRITCRYLRREKLIHPPPLMEGEACASRILEVGPSGAKFLGPVIIEVPHFAAMRGKEREIIILRSDDGESWREHTLEASEEAVREILNESFQGESDLNNLEPEFASDRITRILTTDFPQYFAIITRIRQEVHAIGPEGGMVNSTVVPQVQAIFPEGALTKKIKVGLQAQPIASELVAKMLGNRVAVSPIVTVEPRRRKFHKPITLTIPVPQAATRGMINNYTGDTPTLRLLCSITGGTSKAQWEDVTGSTPLTFVNQCVSFTTTVSARFWLMDCRQINEATKFATDLYREAIAVPFMSKFVVFSKRHDPAEAQMRIFCMTDDKEEKTLEHQEQFTEVAKSRDVEVLEGKPQYLEFAGNLIPVTKSGEQLNLTFQAFRENRLPFLIRVRDASQEPLGKIAFMKEPRKTRGEAPQVPICNLNIQLPETIVEEEPVANNHHQQFTDVQFIKTETIQRSALDDHDIILNADPSIMQMGHELGKDWIKVASHLDLNPNDTEKIKRQFPNQESEQATALLYTVDRKSSVWNNKDLCKILWDIGRKDLITKFYPDSNRFLAEFGIKLNGKLEERSESIKSSKSLPTDREVNLDDKDIMKDAESMDDSEGESVGGLGQPTVPVATTKNKIPSHEVKGREDEERASAVKQYLKYLEDEDREDSEERAAFRGEKTNSNELYIIKEEIRVPSGDSSSIKSTNQIFITSPEPTHESQFKTEEIVEITDEGGLTHSITQVTKTTIIQEVEEPVQVQQRLQKQQSPPHQAQAKQHESAYSNEPDTMSQVSISSIPEDDKSDPTSANISSATTTTTNASDVKVSSVTEEPGHKITVEQNEWFETEASGDVVHIIEQSTTCERTNDKNDLIADENDHEMSYMEKKDYFAKLSNDSKVKPVPLASHYCRSSSIETSGMGNDDRRTSEGEIVETVGAFQDRRAYFESTGGRRSFSIDTSNMDEARTAYSTSLAQRSSATATSTTSGLKESVIGLKEQDEEEEEEEDNSKGNLNSNSLNFVNYESIGKRSCEISDVDVDVNESSGRNKDYRTFLTRDQLYLALNQLEAEIALAQSDLDLTFDNNLKQLDEARITESTTITKVTSTITTQDLANKYLKLNVKKNDESTENVNQESYLCQNNDDQASRSSPAQGTSSMRLIVRNRDEVSVKDFPLNEVDVETGEIARLLVRPTPPRSSYKIVDNTSSTDGSPPTGSVVYKVWKGLDPIERCPSPLRKQFSKALRDLGPLSNEDSDENNSYNNELVGKLSRNVDKAFAITHNQQISSSPTTINHQPKYLINWRSMKDVLTAEGFDLISQAIEIALIQIPNETGYPKYYYIALELIKSLLEASLERVLFYSIEMVRVDCVESGLINLDSPSIPGLSSVPIPYWLPFASKESFQSTTSSSFLSPNVLTKDTWFRLVDVRNVGTQTTFRSGLVSRCVQTNVSYLNPSWSECELFQRLDSPGVDSIQSNAIVEWVGKTSGHRRRPSVSTFRDSIDDDSYLMSLDCRLTNVSWAADRATQTTSEGELFSEEYFDIDDLDVESLKSEFGSVEEDIESDSNSDEISSSERQRYEDLIAANEAIETGLMALVAGELALLTTEMAYDVEADKSDESDSAPPCILYKGDDLPWLDDDGWDSDEQRYTCNGKPNGLSVHRGSHSHASDTSNDFMDNRLSDDEGEVSSKSNNLKVIQDRIDNRTARSNSKHSSSSEGSVVSTGSQTDECEFESIPKYLETDLDTVEIIDGKLSLPKENVKVTSKKFKSKIDSSDHKNVEIIEYQFDEKAIASDTILLSFDYEDDETQMVKEISEILDSQIKPGLLTQSKERSTPTKRSSSLTEFKFDFDDRFEKTENHHESSDLNHKFPVEPSFEDYDNVEPESSGYFAETSNHADSKYYHEISIDAKRKDIESHSEYESEYLDDQVMKDSELADQEAEIVHQMIRPKFNEIFQDPSYIIPEARVSYNSSEVEGTSSDQDYCWMLSQYGSPKVKQAFFQKTKSMELNTDESKLSSFVETKLASPSQPYDDSIKNEETMKNSLITQMLPIGSNRYNSSTPAVSFEQSKTHLEDEPLLSVTEKIKNENVELIQHESEIVEIELNEAQYDENNLISSQEYEKNSLKVKPEKHMLGHNLVSMGEEKFLEDNDDQLNFDELNAEINQIVSDYDPEIEQEQYDNDEWYYRDESQQFDQTVGSDFQVSGVSAPNYYEVSLRKQSSESIEPDYEDYTNEIAMKNETSTYANQVLGAIKDKIASFLSRPTVLSDENSCDVFSDDSSIQYDENNNLIVTDGILSKMSPHFETVPILENKDLFSVQKSLTTDLQANHPQTIECLMMNPNTVQSVSGLTKTELELNIVKNENEAEIEDESESREDIEETSRGFYSNILPKSIASQIADESQQTGEPEVGVTLDCEKNRIMSSIMTSSLESDSLDDGPVCSLENTYFTVAGSEYVDLGHIHSFQPGCLTDNDDTLFSVNERPSDVETREKSINQRSLESEVDIDEDELSHIISDGLYSERKDSDAGGSTGHGPSGSEYDTAVTDQSSSSYKTAVPFSSGDNSFATLQSSSSLESINSIESDKSVIYTELEPSLIVMRVIKDAFDSQDKEKQSDEELIDNSFVGIISDHLPNEAASLMELNPSAAVDPIQSQLDNLREIILARTDSLDSNEYDELTYVADDFPEDPVEPFDISSEANKLKARLLDILNRPTVLSEPKILEDDEITETSSLNESGSSKDIVGEEQEEIQTSSQIIDEELIEMIGDEKIMNEIVEEEVGECTFDEITELDTITQSFEETDYPNDYMASCIEENETQAKDDTLIIDTIQPFDEVTELSSPESMMLAKQVNEINDKIQTVAVQSSVNLRNESDSKDTNDDESPEPKSSVETEITEEFESQLIPIVFDVPPSEDETIATDEIISTIISDSLPSEEVSNEVIDSISANVADQLITNELDFHVTDSICIDELNEVVNLSIIKDQDKPNITEALILESKSDFVGETETVIENTDSHVSDLAEDKQLQESISLRLESQFCEPLSPEFESPKDETILDSQESQNIKKHDSNDENFTQKSKTIENEERRLTDDQQNRHEEMKDLETHELNFGSFSSEDKTQEIGNTSVAEQKKIAASGSDEKSEEPESEIVIPESSESRSELELRDFDKNIAINSNVADDVKSVGSKISDETGSIDLWESIDQSEDSSSVRTDEFKDAPEDFEENGSFSTPIDKLDDVSFDSQNKFGTIKRKKPAVESKSNEFKVSAESLIETEKPEHIVGIELKQAMKYSKVIVDDEMNFSDQIDQPKKQQTGNSVESARAEEDLSGLEENSITLSNLNLEVENVFVTNLESAPVLTIQNVDSGEETENETNELFNTSTDQVNSIKSSEITSTFLDKSVDFEQKSEILDPTRYEANLNDIKSSSNRLEESEPVKQEKKSATSMRSTQSGKVVDRSEEIVLKDESIDETEFSILKVDDILVSTDKLYQVPENQLEFKAPESLRNSQDSLVSADYKDQIEEVYLAYTESEQIVTIKTVGSESQDETVVRISSKSSPAVKRPSSEPIEQKEVRAESIKNDTVVTDEKSLINESVEDIPSSFEKRDEAKLTINGGLVEIDNPIESVFNLADYVTSRQSTGPNEKKLDTNEKVEKMSKKMEVISKKTPELYQTNEQIVFDVKTEFESSLVAEDKFHKQSIDHATNESVYQEIQSEKTLDKLRQASKVVKESESIQPTCESISDQPNKPARSKKIAKSKVYVNQGKSPEELLSPILDADHEAEVIDKTFNEQPKVESNKSSPNENTVIESMIADKETIQKDGIKKQKSSNSELNSSQSDVEGIEYDVNQVDSPLKDDSEKSNKLNSKNESCKSKSEGSWKLIKTNNSLIVSLDQLDPEMVNQNESFTSSYDYRTSEVKIIQNNLCEPSEIKIHLVESYVNPEFIEKETESIDAMPKIGVDYDLDTIEIKYDDNLMKAICLQPTVLINIETKDDQVSIDIEDKNEELINDDFDLTDNVVQTASSNSESKIQKLDENNEMKLDDFEMEASEQLFSPKVQSDASKSTRQKSHLEKCLSQVIDTQNEKSSADSRNSQVDLDKENNLESCALDERDEFEESPSSEISQETNKLPPETAETESKTSIDEVIKIKKTSKEKNTKAKSASVNEKSKENVSKDEIKFKKDRVVAKSDSIDKLQIKTQEDDGSRTVQENKSVESNSDKIKARTESEIIVNSDLKLEENVKTSVSDSKDITTDRKIGSGIIENKVSTKNESEKSANESNFNKDVALKVYDEIESEKDIQRLDKDDSKATKKIEIKKNEDKKISPSDDDETKKMLKVNEDFAKGSLEEKNDEKIKGDKGDKANDDRKSNKTRKSISPQQILSEDLVVKNVEEPEKSKSKETSTDTFKHESNEEKSIKDDQDNLNKIKDKSEEYKSTERRRKSKLIDENGEKVKKVIKKSSIKSKETIKLSTHSKPLDSTEVTLIQNQSDETKSESFPLQNKDNNSAKLSEKDEDKSQHSSKQLITDSKKSKSPELIQTVNVQLEAPFIGGALTWKMPISVPSESRKESPKQDINSENQSVTITQKSSSVTDLNTIKIKRQSKPSIKQETEIFKSATIKDELSSKALDNQLQDDSLISNIQAKVTEKSSLNKQSEVELNKMINDENETTIKKGARKSSPRKTIKSKMYEKDSASTMKPLTINISSPDTLEIDNSLSQVKSVKTKSIVEKSINYNSEDYSVRSKSTTSTSSIENYDSHYVMKSTHQSRRDLIPPMSPSRRPSLTRSTTRRRSLSRPRDIKANIPSNNYDYIQQSFKISKPMGNISNSAGSDCSTNNFVSKSSNDQSLKLFTSSRLLDEQLNRLSRFDYYNRNLIDSRSMMHSFRRSYESLNDIYNQIVDSEKSNQSLSRWNDNYKYDSGSRKYNGYKLTSLSVDRNRFLRSLDYSSHRYITRQQSLNYDYRRKCINSDLNMSNDYLSLFNSLRDRINKFKPDCRKRWRKIESDYIYHSCPDILSLKSRPLATNKMARYRNQDLSGVSVKLTSSTIDKNNQRRFRQSADYQENRKSTSSFNIEYDLNNERRRRIDYYKCDNFSCKPISNSYKSTSYYSSVQDINHYDAKSNYNRKHFIEDDTSKAYLQTLGPVINSNSINQFNYRPSRLNSTKSVNLSARRRESSSPPTIGFNYSSTKYNFDYNSTWNLTYGSEDISSTTKSVNQPQLKTNISSQRTFYTSNEKLINYDYDQLTISRSYVNLTDTKSYLNDDLERKIVRARSNWSRTESAIKVSNHDKPLTTRKRFITSR